MSRPEAVIFVKFRREAKGDVGGANETKRQFLHLRLKGIWE